MTVSESTKDALLRVAIEVINQGGESAIRLDSILAEVGVSPSSLYHHYGSLNGLIEAAHVERFQNAVYSNAVELKRRIEETESRESFVALIDSMMDMFFSSVREIPRQHRVNVLGNAFGRPALLEAIAAAQKQSLLIATEAMRIAQSKEFVNQDLDVAAFVAWFDGMAWGRVLIEISPEDGQGAMWNQIAKRAVHSVLFG
jgi:AcrR family transcriptional regulator